MRTPDNLKPTDPMPLRMSRLDRPLTKRELLEYATVDAREGAAAMERGDYLQADILLKLAIDQIADAGILP